MKLYSKEELKEKINEEIDSTFFLVKYETFTPFYIENVVARVREQLKERNEELLRKISDQEILEVWSKYYGKVFTSIEATVEEICFKN